MLCNRFLNGEVSDTSVLQNLANNASLTGIVTDLNLFAANYVDAFATGYNCAFGIAAVAMLISFLIFVFFQKYISSNNEYQVKQKAEKVSFKNLTPDEKERMKALGLIFIVVIFF
jgi:POT family proton-dependent oligopeptide transporter